MQADLDDMTADREAELQRRRDVVRKRQLSTLRRRLEMTRRAVQMAAAGRATDFLVTAHAEKLAQALSDCVGEES